MPRLWPSEIICCHQQCLIHLKSGNSKVLLLTRDKMIGVAQFFSLILFFFQQQCIIFCMGKLQVHHFILLKHLFHLWYAPHRRFGSSDSTANCSSIRSFTVNAGNQSKFPKYSFFTITNEGIDTSYSL